MGFFYFIVILLVGKWMHSRLNSRINALSQDVEGLRKELARLGGPNQSPSSLTSSLAPSSAPKPIQAVSVARPVDTFIRTKSHSRPKRLVDLKFWKSLEEQFAGNVTGVAGSLAMVLGVVFLAVYAAIQLDPVGRFGVVVLFSAALLGLYQFLQTKPFWKKMSLWVRSASGILFLMGCIGSIGLEAMKWVDDPWLGVALLSLGLATNLVLGFLNGAQIFASLHVLMSLAALAVIPVTVMTFTIAVIVVVSGILMSSRERQWDRHVFATTVGFTLLHVGWFFKEGGLQGNFPVESLTAIILCLMVGCSALATHYRASYRTTAIQRVPLLAHVTTWATLGLNLYLHSKGTPWSTIFLAIASALAFMMSVQASRLQIQWLVVCDRLVSLLLILLSVFSLRRFGLSGIEIPALAAMVSVIFLGVVSHTFERTVFRASLAVGLLIYLILGIYGALLLSDSEPLPISIFPMLIGSFVLLSTLLPRIQSKEIEQKSGFKYSFGEKTYTASMLEIPLAFHGVLALLLAQKMTDEPRVLAIAYLMLYVTLALRARQKNLCLDIATLTAAFLMAGYSLFLMLGLKEASTALIHFAGVMGLGAIGFKQSKVEELNVEVTWPGVAVIWSALMVGAYSFTLTISPILTGIAWLFLSLISFELKDLARFNNVDVKHARTGTYISGFALLGLALFAIRFFLVDMSNEALAFGVIRVRYFPEVLSLGVLFYGFALAQPSQTKWLRTGMKLLLEVFSLFLVAYVLLEINTAMHPLIWVVLGFCAFFAGRRFKSFNRLSLYGYWGYFGALFHIAFVSSSLATPSQLWTNQSWVMGLIAVFTSTVFMVFAHRDRKATFETQFDLPAPLRRLVVFQEFLRRFEVKALLYPLFVAVAFFLYWSFDRTLLSLLWVVECFALFLISIMLREPQFRVVSMIGIGVIFLRIVFYDLTGEDFFIKAIVFISVGAILIAMNAIYNKYKHRYDAK